MKGVTECDLTEYYSNAIANAVNQKNRNEWVLVSRYKNGNKR